MFQPIYIYLQNSISCATTPTIGSLPDADSVREQDRDGAVVPEPAQQLSEEPGAGAPWIEIKAEPTDDHWLLSVQDNGIGITRPTTNGFFSLFQRLLPSQYPGTGIGLALCR